MLIKSIISRIQRNHGLEHATIHVLSGANPRRKLIGRSDMWGFWMLGEVDTEEMAEAVQHALARLRAGEHTLAVHPNCGTNFVTYGIAAGAGALVAMTGAGPRQRDRLERLPLAGLLATIALILAQPLAFLVQKRFTTSGTPQGLRVVSVIRSDIGGRTAHRIKTQG